MNIESHLKSGRVLNHRYRIDELLATGGFGEVYAAFDRLMERKVALKYIFRRLNVEQLRNEVIILARHAEKLKFIPNVYDHWAGSRNDVGYYIVMEFVEGETLDKSRALPWPSDDVTDFLRILLSNLRDLHSLRIIHCDIKPINIKLTPRSDWSYHVPYRLLDFGIAKQGDETTVPATTPHYAAPEQYHLSGRNVKIDHRTDLYGLAATAYFLLTGRPPIEARIRYSNVFDLQHPDPLRAPSALVSGASWALEETLLDMLQLDRDLRPRNAADALQSLERRLKEPPSAATKPPGPETEPAADSAPAAPAQELPPLLLTEPPAKAGSTIVVALPTAIPSAPIFRPATSIDSQMPVQPALSAVAREPAPKPPAAAAPVVPAGKAAALLDKHGYGVITSIAWSPDAQALLIGTTLGVYRYHTQSAICELWQESDLPVQHVGLACAGQKVALTIGDTLRLVDSAGDSASTTLSAPAQALPGQVLSATRGNAIAIVTDAGLYIFDPDTDSQTAAWRLSPRLTGRKAALSSDGEIVVVADSGQLWCAALRGDLRGRQWVVGGLPQPLVDIALTLDGRQVVVASPDAIAIWRRGDKAAQPLAYDGDPIVKIALSSDGATLAAATGAGAFLRSLDGAGKPKALIEGELSGIQQLAFSPDDRTLAAATLGEIRLWRVRDGSVEHAITQFGPCGRRLALLAGRPDLAVLGRTLQLWSIDHDRLLPGPALGSAPARSFAVLADAQSERIAVAADAALQIWNPAEQSLQYAIAALPAQERCLGFAADSGQWLVVAPDAVEAYDLATGQALARVALGDRQTIEHVALAPAGRRLAIHGNGRISVRRLPDGEAMYALPRTDCEVAAIGFGGDGALLAVADEARITLWRIDEDAPVRLGVAELPEQSPARHLIFASDGSALASLHGSVVHLWRVAEGTLRYVGAARGHADRVIDAILTPEGTHLVTTSRDGALRLWAVPD